MNASTGAGQCDILDLWSELVDRRTGIVREVRELLIDDDEPGFVHYLSFAASTEAWGLLPNFGNNGGVGTDRRTALRKALGEAVERYCSAVFSYADLIWSTYGELRDRAVCPEAFALYLQRQYASPDFPWEPFQDGTPVSWTTGVSLVDGEPVLVPAAFVFVPYQYRTSWPDTPITQPISTGLACGTSWHDATSAALCEVIERDAFCITWQRRLSRPRIRNASLPSQTRSLVRLFHDVGIDVHLIDISSDIPCPTVMAIAEGHALSSPAVAVAAAAHRDAGVACVKAIEELAHTRRFASQVMDYLPEVAVDIENGHPDVQCQRGHLRFYCPQSSKRYANFLWSSDAEINLTDVGNGGADRPGSLEHLVDEIAGKGEEVVACNLTTPDVAELGLSVVRVVVPGLHPLHMGHQNRALGGRRLRHVPDLLGASSDSFDNPFPHPFP